MIENEDQHGKTADLIVSQEKELHIEKYVGRGGKEIGKDRSFPLEDAGSTARLRQIFPKCFTMCRRFPLVMFSPQH